MRIIYLDLDCMRPDHFGCHGYHRDTTPNLDCIASRSVRFTGAYCSDSPCVPSRAATFSVRHGIHNGVATHWGPGSEFRYRDDVPMLARHLYANGYYTVSFSSFADRHQAWWFAAGWRELHTFTLKRGGESADEVNAAVIPWLKQHATMENYFLHIHYWDPHRIYREPKEWAAKFDNDPPPNWPDEAAIESQQDTYGPFTARYLYPGKGRHPDIMPDAIASLNDWIKFVNAYDGAIAYMDWHVGQILEVLEDVGVLDDICFIITADHGEAMGEQGVYGDHVCGYEAVHNVPLIVRWPGVARENEECDALVYGLDIGPTLCELLGFEVPKGWEGESLVPYLRGDDGVKKRNHLVWTHGLYSCQRSVRTERWLYVRTYHPGLFPFGPIDLFDMKADPHQTKNLADERPEIVMEMDHFLIEWYQKNLGYHGAEPDPLQEVIRTGPWKYVHLEQWIRRLRGEGQDDAANEILARIGMKR